MMRMDDGMDGDDDGMDDDDDDCDDDEYGDDTNCGRRTVTRMDDG